MPNIHDTFEPLLADLDNSDEYLVKMLARPGLTDERRVEVESLKRIVAGTRHLVELLVDLGADLDVAQARIAELEAQLADVRKGFAP